MGFKKRPEISKRYWVDVFLDTEHYIVRQPDSSDCWDRGIDGYFLRGVHVYQKSIETSGVYVKYYDEAPEFNEGDTAYVLVEEYSTGNTFGRTERTFSERGVFKTREEAESKIGTEPRACGYFDSHIDFHIHEVKVEVV